MGQGRQRDSQLESVLNSSAVKEKPLRSALPRGLEAREEDASPAPARAATPWGQGHLGADPMLQRDSDKI
jgi:hypothetical protein